MGQLRSQALFGEPEYLQVSKVPTPNGKVG
jgi:hypothetical protein